jgi:acetoacetate decarboxylase
VSHSAQVLYTSDADTLAELLPPPLRPSTPTVWVSFGHIPQFQLGVAQVAVAACYGDEEGWYCLHLPMTTEMAVVGGRERYGENKKLADIAYERDGNRIRSSVTRYGITYLELDATVTGEREVPDEQHVPHYYFKYLLAPDGSGFDHPPVMVRSLHHRNTRRAESLDAELILRDSQFDPLADLPVLSIDDAFVTERTNYIEATVVEQVDPDAFIPYTYQRYDILGQG